MAYATVDEALARMGHPNATDANLIARLTDALDAATTAIDSMTGRSFASTSATKTFGSDGGTVIRIPDLVSVTTLKVDDDDDGVFEVTISSSDYELDTYRTTAGWPYEVVRLLERNFPYVGKRRRRIEIVGTWGWSAVPAPINQACSLLAARWAQRATSALYGVQSFGDIGAASIRNTDPDVTALVGPYVLPQVA